MQQWRWVIGQLGKRIWFRAALISILSILLALAANALAPLIPYEFAKLGDGAVGSVLTVLASSMLAVTTFSLTAMVTAFSGASQSGTPRATELLVEDASAQNALSTFLGAFLFSIVGIIALQANYYGPQGRAILLIGTIGVIVWISIVLLQWIGQLTHFGRVADTIDRVERKARRALKRYDGPLKIAGKGLRHPQDDAAVIVCSKRTGYVAHVNRKRLSELAERKDMTIHMTAPAGTFVDRSRALCWLEETPAKEEEENGYLDKLRACFTIDDSRDFDQDPRFGVVVLAEIASRALSPAVNDPGTAIAVLSSALRVFDDFLDHDIPGPEDKPGLVEPALSLEEMVRDLIVPVARDGATLVEVHLRVQEVLGAIAARTPEDSVVFDTLADEALQRSMRALTDPNDQLRLRKAHQAAFDETSGVQRFHRAR